MGFQSVEWHRSCGESATHPFWLRKHSGVTHQKGSFTIFGGGLLIEGGTRWDAPLLDPPLVGVDVSQRGHRIPQSRVLDANTTGELWPNNRVENDEESIRGRATTGHTRGQ